LTEAGEQVPGSDQLNPHLFLPLVMSYPSCEEMFK